MIEDLDESIYMISNNLSCYEVVKLLEEFVFTYIKINLYQRKVTIFVLFLLLLRQ